jgi:hypothetical protein
MQHAHLAVQQVHEADTGTNSNLHLAVSINISQRGAAEHVGCELCGGGGEVQVLGPLQHLGAQVVGNNAPCRRGDQW